MLSSWRSTSRRRELLHDLLGHALVRLVLEVEDVPSTRVRARRPDERGDRASAVVAHLGDRSVSRQRIGGQSEVASGDRRDDRDLVPRGQGLGALGVRLVARVQKPGGLVAERELRPDVAHGRTLVELEFERPGARLLAERGEEPHVHVHGLSVAAGCLDARDMLGPAR